MHNSLVNLSAPAVRFVLTPADKAKLLLSVYILHYKNAILVAVAATFRAIVLQYVCIVSYILHFFNIFLQICTKLS